MDNCLIRNFSAGGHGVHIKGFKEVWVINTLVHDGGGTVLFHGIYLLRCGEAHVQNNTLKDLGAVGIKCQSNQQGDLTTVSGNIINNMGFRAILMQDHDRYTVTNNIIEDCAERGIACTLDQESIAQLQCVISDNILHTITDEGIFAQLQKNLIISNNTINDSLKSGVSIRDCGQTQVINNNIRVGTTIDAGGWSGIDVENGPTDALDNTITGNMIRCDAVAGTRNGIIINETAGNER